MPMNKRRLLYLTAQQMVCCHWHSGKLDQSEVFPANENGYRQFSAYLALHAKDIYTLLLNVSEEGFHIETIPFLQGNDHPALLRKARAAGRLRLCGQRRAGDDLRRRSSAVLQPGGGSDDPL